MSNTGDNRWRRPGPGQGNNGNNGNRQNANANAEARGSGSNTPMGSNGAQTRTQGISSTSGNVWGGSKGKVAGQSQGQGQTQAQAQAQAPAVSSNNNGFNAAEILEFMQKSYNDATKNKPDAHYKPTGDSVEKRGSGVWGSRGIKPNEMADGKDFVQDLCKQVAALEAKKKSS